MSNKAFSGLFDRTTKQSRLLYEILPQGMPREILPKQNPLHIGVSFEMNTHQVPYLPLLQVRSLPYWRERIYDRLLPAIAASLEHHRVVLSHREQVVDQFKVVNVIDCADRRKEGEVQV